MNQSDSSHLIRSSSSICVLILILVATISSFLNLLQDWILGNKESVSLGDLVEDLSTHQAEEHDAHDVQEDEKVTQMSSVNPLSAFRYATKESSLLKSNFSHEG